jgi:serine/threonine-protein kinase
MLCGVAPFNGENVTALMYQIVNFVPPPPSTVTSSVPEVLDLIIAKMIAKPLEERYQDAAEVARDLRECERQVVAAGTASTTTTQPLQPGTSVSVLQPTLVDSVAKNTVLAQTVSRTREADQATEDTPPPPARGLASSFDSIEATQRLASLTGAQTTPQTATQAIKSIPRDSATKWRRRDWLAVAGAGVCGLLVARAVLRRKP